MTYKEAVNLKKGDTVICKTTGNLLTVYYILSKTDKKVEIETRDKDGLYETYFHNRLILL